MKTKKGKQTMKTTRNKIEPGAYEILSDAGAYFAYKNDNINESVSWTMGRPVSWASPYELDESTVSYHNSIQECQKVVSRRAQQQEQEERTRR